MTCCGRTVPGLVDEARVHRHDRARDRRRLGRDGLLQRLVGADRERAEPLDVRGQARVGAVLGRRRRDRRGARRRGGREREEQDERRPGPGTSRRVVNTIGGRPQVLCGVHLGVPGLSSRRSRCRTHVPPQALSLRRGRRGDDPRRVRPRRRAVVGPRRRPRLHRPGRRAAGPVHPHARRRDRVQRRRLDPGRAGPAQPAGAPAGPQPATTWAGAPDFDTGFSAWAAGDRIMYVGPSGRRVKVGIATGPSRDLDDDAARAGHRRRARGRRGRRRTRARPASSRPSRAAAATSISSASSARTRRPRPSSSRARRRSASARSRWR